MESKVNSSRRFKKGDIVKLHGEEQLDVVTADETEHNMINVNGMGGEHDGLSHCFVCKHDSSPLKKGDVVLVRAVDEVDQPSAASNDVCDDKDDCDCDEADNYLDIDAIADICDMATQLATMSKDSLIDLAACTSDVNGISSATGAAEIAESDGNDKPTRANYIHVILFNYIDAKYGNEND